ncbi:ABC transporter ATP-binding protein [Eubacterium oxidoreducens]|uniref:Putative ABC transport system ATP-binding protein n=1 Tax=Eubacterium oxidoreducens TaxID=1732 RepID=A0A1G6C1Y9_EUBOX|nr:ATP-binding cassette domain-containing protein [Eubacterium oxidoreducens]SDB26899.1 putative ABC transport system ATP-binding protein [Eubacterium oxidoreducens]
MRLVADHISKRYESGGIEDLSFLIEPESFTLVKGESGVGKTTLLNVITGCLHPDCGAVYIDGREIYTQMKRHERTALLQHKIGYMMQGISLIPSMSVYDNILYPYKLNNTACKDITDRIDEIFEELGIANIKQSTPARISAGEYRRVLLAGVLCKRPQVLIADEPTSNLDEKTADLVRQTLYDYVSANNSVIVATHDYKFADADRIIHLSNQKDDVKGVY